jgi:hypothetical protein
MAVRLAAALMVVRLASAAADQVPVRRLTPKVSANPATGAMCLSVTGMFQISSYTSSE